MIAQLPPEPVASIPTRGIRHGLTCFFHFATLGAILPLLPLFFLRTLGLDWIETGLAVAAFPFALIVSPAIQRLARAVMLTPADGIALSHLAAAGLSMGFSLWWEQAGFRSVEPAILIPCLFAYAIVLTPAFVWINDLTATQASPGTESISWRLWGAVGFIAPAWLSEGILSGVTGYGPDVVSHRILPVLAGWLGIAAAGAALSLRDKSDSPVSVPDDSDKGCVRPNVQFVLGIALVIALQRSHWLWTAPYFSAVLSAHVDAAPLVHRLIVVSHVFEVAVLVSLGFVLSRVGVKPVLVFSTGLWVGRSVLLAWVSQTAMAGSWQLGSLFVAQFLQGVALAGFFGALGILLLKCLTPRLRFQMGLAGIAGCLLGGFTTGLLAGQIAEINPERLLETLTSEVGVLHFGGWAGIWWFSTLPGLVAVLLIASANLPDSIESDADLSGAVGELPAGHVGSATCAGSPDGPG